MLRIAIASILTMTAACHDCPPDDEPAEDSSSSSSSAGESESSTGDDECATALHVCWDSDVDFTECLDAFFACDPDAEVYYEVCTDQVLACIWTCCPYEVGAPGWQNNCLTDEIEACEDACGLFANCLPDEP